jgi:hypothetical protein
MEQQHCLFSNRCVTGCEGIWRTVDVAWIYWKSAFVKYVLRSTKRSGIILLNVLTRRNIFEGDCKRKYLLPTLIVDSSNSIIIIRVSSSSVAERVPLMAIYQSLQENCTSGIGSF